MEPTAADIRTALYGKAVAVTGGTGSFGHQIVRQLMAYDPSVVWILSRDEKKQYDMQQRYLPAGLPLRFALADVRDESRLREVFRDIDVVFHAAALKQVPAVEFNPYEAVKTNIIGAENVRRAAIDAGVECVVGVSTDKAVKPVNVMGMSKAIQERLLLDLASVDSPTRFVCVRYGNVLGSRGSVVPLFRDYILRGEPLPITHMGMTRFQLTLSEAVELVFLATAHGATGDLWVRKMPAAGIVDLGQALAFGLTGRRDYPISIVGARPGEKMHEVLVSEEEMWRAEEFDHHFRIPAWGARAHAPGPSEGEFDEYSSSGVHRLTEAELLSLLEDDGWFSESTA